MRYNPYDRGNPIEAGIRSAAGVIGIQDAVQARRDRAEDRGIAAEERERRRGFEDEDRGYLRKVRGREDAAYEREQALQAPLEEEMGIRKAERAGRMAQAQDIPAQVEHQRKARIYTESGWLTPEQQKRMTALGLEQAEVGVAAARENIAASREKRQAARDDRSNVRRIVEQFNTAMHKVGTLKDEAAADTVMDTYHAVASRDVAALEALWPQVIPTLGRIIEDDIEHGVGDVIEATGETITGKRLADIKLQGDDAILEFEVTAQGKDGKKRTYFAPPTEGRGTDPKARVVKVPLAELEGWLQEAAAHALDVQEGAISEDSIRREALQALIASGMDAKNAEALIGSDSTDPKQMGSMGKDLDYLMNTFTDGDKQAAVEMYKRLKAASAKPRNEKLEIVKALLQRSRGRMPTEEDINNLMRLSGIDEDTGSTSSGNGGGAGTEDFSSLWGGQ
jgi:hypothetical protein